MKTREEIYETFVGPTMSLSTPFLENGAIDYQGIYEIIDFSISAGSPAIILTQGDSLYTLLTDQEVAELTKAVVDHTAGRAVVVAANRTWPTGKTVEFAKYVSEIGADLLLVKAPDWAQSCTADTLVEHYAAAAEHLPVMIVTNVFENRPVSSSIDVIRRLRDEVPGVWAVKDDVQGDFRRRLGLLVHDCWATVAAGTKRSFLEARLHGLKCHMSFFISCCPEVTHDFWRAIHARDDAEIQRIIADIELPFYDFITELAGGFDAGVHGVLELKGLAKRYRRRPYYSLNDAEMEKLAHLLKAIGLL